MFMVADSNVYGMSVKRILEPTADGLKGEDGAFHWMLVTVLCMRLSVVMGNEVLLSKVASHKRGTETLLRGGALKVKIF